MKKPIYLTVICSLFPLFIICQPLNLAELNQLIVEQKVLKERIEILNDVNDKILNTTYWTIGIILSSVIGASIWHAYKTHVLNKRHIELHFQNIKQELTELIKSEISLQINNNKHYLSNEINILKHNLFSLKRDYYISRINHHPYHEDTNEHDRIIKYLQLISESKSEIDLDVTLRMLNSYLKSNDYFYEGNVVDINKFLNEIKSYNALEIQINEIKRLLSEKIKK